MLTNILISISAISVLYLVYAQLKKKTLESSLDIKTNSYNIETFKKYFQKQQMNSLGMIVLSNLGSINKQYGVESTDLLLKNMVERLKDYIELESDEKYIIGRHCGAEFLLATQEDSDKLHNYIQGYIQENPTINNISIAYKYAAVSKEDFGFEATIANVQKITYFPSNATPTIRDNVDSVNVIDMDNRVVQALDEKNLNFYFKPIVNVDTGTIKMFDISVKMYDGIQEIEPREFLPIINKLDLGREYDYILLECISIFLLLTDDKISFFLNVSPFSLQDESFQKRVRVLSRNSEDPFRLILGLYERKGYDDLDTHLRALSFMHSCGFRLAIDNFSNSASSLDYIDSFDFDMVRLDKGYIKKLHNNIDYIHSCISDVKSRDIETIAKWVDNNRQKEQLKELDIDYMQGFGVGGEITEEELLALYK